MRNEGRVAESFLFLTNATFRDIPFLARHPRGTKKMGIRGLKKRPKFDEFNRVTNITVTGVYVQAGSSHFLADVIIIIQLFAPERVYHRSSIGSVSSRVQKREGTRRFDERRGIIDAIRIGWSLDDSYVIRDSFECIISKRTSYLYLSRRISLFPFPSFPVSLSRFPFLFFRFLLQ